VVSDATGINVRAFGEHGGDLLSPWPQDSLARDGFQIVAGLVVEVRATHTEGNSFPFERLSDVCRAHPVTAAPLYGGSRLVVDWASSELLGALRRSYELRLIPPALAGGRLDDILAFIERFVVDVHGTFTGSFAQVRRERGLVSTEHQANLLATYLQAYELTYAKPFPQTLIEQLYVVIQSCLAARAPRAVNDSVAVSFRIRSNVSEIGLDEVDAAGLAYPKWLVDSERSVIVSKSHSLSELRAGVGVAVDAASAMEGQIAEFRRNVDRWYAIHPESEWAIGFVATGNGVRVFDVWSPEADDLARLRRVVTLLDHGDKGSIRRALLSLEPGSIEAATARQLADTSGLRLIGRGICGTGGVATGVTCFDAADITAARQQGHPAILVAPDAGPELLDIALASDGFVLSRGGATSHLAVIARSAGKPAILGVGEITFAETQDASDSGSITVRRGEWITVDANGARLYRGHGSSVSSPQRAGAAALHRVLAYCDTTATVKIYVNADVAAEATAGIDNGATGVGLCRLEHLLGRPDTLSLLQSALVLSWMASEGAQDMWHAEMQAATWPTSSAAHARVLVERRRGQSETRDELVDILAKLRAILIRELQNLIVAADGRPVIIRLLDPPLSEFVDRRVLDGLFNVISDSRRRKRVEEWLDDPNPMLGVRGVRLCLLAPELTKTLLGAIMVASVGASRIAVRHQPSVGILIPMLTDTAEVAAIRHLIAQARQFEAIPTEWSFSVGAMIETPRAALCAAQLAAEVDFLSIGTNDLTQFLWAASRDSAEQRFMQLLPYQQLLSSPFATLDSVVGELICDVVRSARGVAPDIPIGVCGEQVSAPSSVDMLQKAGVTYISGAASVVPRLRLAAGQAALQDPSRYALTRSGDS
jgi:phosphohistidine swiveling domain-containing protein